MEWEPELRCVAALHSPSTGIIDSHSLMLAYLGDAESHGAMLALKSGLIGADVVPDSFVLHIGGDDAMTLNSPVLLTNAGLRRPSSARPLEAYPPSVRTKD